MNQDIDNEQWKTIQEFNGKYEVSNFGRIKSVKRKCNSRYGEYKTVPEKILSLNKDKQTGYVSVTLADGNKRITRFVHRLVAISFIDNEENKPCVNHIDGDKTNNNLSNLEWVTMKENSKHAFNKQFIRQKTSWNREEVIKLLNDFGEHVAFEVFGINYFMIGELNKWIEENL